MKIELFPGRSEKSKDAEKVDDRIGFRKDLKRFIDTLRSDREEEKAVEAEYIKARYGESMGGFISEMFDKNTGAVDNNGLRQVLDQVKEWDKYDKEASADWERYEI